MGGLPDNNGRLFVGGVPPGTGDEDLRLHFCRYGEVTDVCQPKDRLNGLPRGFAFVQFPRPADAGRALADPQHVINGEQVNVARAKPRSAYKYKPLCQRVFGSRGRSYRVGDMLKISAGPLGDDCEESEVVKTVRKFGVMVDKTLFFECLIGYISPDGTECMVRWPPVQSDDRLLSDRQGSIVPAWTCSLKELAQFSSHGNLASANCCRYCLGFSPGCAATAHSCCNPDGGSVGVGHAPSSAEPTHRPEAAPSQNWSWHVFHRPG